MRTEEDSFGRIKVPSDAYYGAFTQRASLNFPISGIRFQEDFIKAYAKLKYSAVLANAKLGSIDAKKAKAIERACKEVMSGRHYNQFIVDVVQAGAGTSTNMNLNEVIANRALEMMGKRRGDYRTISPNDHVNMSQSTNDTFQSAAHIAAYTMIEDGLLGVLHDYQDAIEKKSKEFSRLMKSGRTHLMDAVPITLGQEFSGYSIEQEIINLKRTSHDLLYISVGGTAVGTGLNTYPEFTKIFLKELNLTTGYYFMRARNRFSMTQNLSTISEVSSSLKGIALKLIKMANDIRLMSSGPHTGLNEITLPEVQPGSSIMPGKVNPSMAEMLTMACFQVIGYDEAITMAAQAGQFELNVFGPIAIYDFLESIRILTNSVRVFTEKCIRGIKPKRERLAYYFEHSAAVATALSPILGYRKTAELVKEAEQRGISIRALALEKRLLPKRELDRTFSPSRLTKPNLPLKK